jgi:hypothetical protein
MPTPELQEFFAKIPGGDAGAVEATLRELDPVLRRVIRMRLLDRRLRRAADTTEIPQRCSMRKSAAGQTPCERGSMGVCRDAYRARRRGLVRYASA